MPQVHVIVTRTHEERGHTIVRGDNDDELEEAVAKLAGDQPLLEALLDTDNVETEVRIRVVPIKERRGA